MCSITNDKFFILSIVEMNSKFYDSEPKCGIEGVEYTYWTTAERPSKMKYTRASNLWPHDAWLSLLGYTKDGAVDNSYYWWLRSPSLTEKSVFSCMGTDYYSWYSASCGCGVVPAFSF